MSIPLVIISQETPRIAIITLNRPAKRNALNIELMQAFAEAVEKTITLQEQRVIIIRGEGSVFCSGLDLEEAQDTSKADMSAKLIAKILTLLYECPCITIAAVHGAAIAGGAGLMSVCDLVIAEKGAVFGFPESRRGLVAALIMVFLRRQLRQRDLNELLLTGSLIHVEKAREIGLINEIVESYEDLMPKALKTAEDIILGAPNATELTKSLLQEMNGRCFLQDLEQALEVHEESRLSEEVQEGIKAFLEKRLPSWAS